MPLFEVAAVTIPNIKAQEAGDEEKLVIRPTAVIAKDEQAAIARVAADNAKSVQDAKGSELKFAVRRFS